MEQVITGTNGKLTSSASATDAVSNPSYQAYKILRLGFTAAPILA